jgi:hypothetical protein
MHDVINLKEVRDRRVRQASDSGGPTSNGNWLAQLASGTRFLAKKRSDPDSELSEFIVGAKISDVVLLAKNLGFGAESKWHIPELFSQNWKLYLVLENVNGDPSQIQHRGLEGHAGSEEQPDLHEDE